MLCILGLVPTKNMIRPKILIFTGHLWTKTVFLLGFNSIFRLYQIFKLKFDYKGVRYGFSNIDTRERAYSKLSKKHSKFQIRPWEDTQNLGYVLR